MVLVFATVVYGVCEGLCRRIQGDELVCTGQWNGRERKWIKHLVIRDWERHCARPRGAVITIFARGMTCALLHSQCAFWPRRVNKEECGKVCNCFHIN